MRKARRVCVATDMYIPVAPFMRTLHREVRDSDDEIGRVRDAKPGEETLYDDLHSEGTQHRYRDIDPLTGEWGEARQEHPPNFFYTEVDAAEDLILFPEEAAGVSKKAITGAGVADALEFLENGLPNMKRFVLDLDSDEDEQDMDDPFEDKLDKLAIEDRPPARKQITAEEEWETEGSDEDGFPKPPADLPECPNPDADDCECEECQWWDKNHREVIPSLEDSVKRFGHA